LLFTHWVQASAVSFAPQNRMNTGVGPIIRRFRPTSKRKCGLSLRRCNPPMKKALVINAPHSKSVSGYDFRSFEKIFSSGVGPTYIVSDYDREQLPAGSKVIIIDNEYEKRAEAQLAEFTFAEMAGNGQARYDVHLVNPKMVPYKKERLNRNGVAIVDDP
jgi:hypothetical protein